MHRRLGIACLVAVIGASIAVLYAQTPDPGRGGVWVSGGAGQRAGSDGTFNTLTVTSTAADAIDVAGGLTAGSGNVAIIDTSGKLPALSATYLASLSGAALTSLDAGNISAGTLVVGRGGTGATTLTDGGVLLGSGTGAVTALAALSDGVIVIGDGSGDPTTLDVGASGGITILGTIATGVWNGTAVTAAYGGTGATSLTDGGVLLGSGTGAVTALAALGDGSIVIGDGSGDPTTLDVGSSTAITVLGTVATGTWQATDVGVAYGGTGVSTLTDGGVLFGSGSGAISALAVLSDSQMIVGDGSGDPVAESGATLRTSIGVGTGDSLTFTGLTVSGTGASALDVGGGLNIGTGDVALIGTDGKLSGPLSSTIIDDLSAANLTGIPGGQITGAIAAVSGANLTTLNASNISSGTLANARLPTNIDVGGTLDVTSATKLDGALEVSGHTFLDGTLSIGYLNASLNKILIGGPYTSPGTSTYAQVVAMSTALTAVTGDTSWAVGVNIGPSITTQDSETIADVASVVIAEPEITKGSGGAAVTRASTLWIRNAPTEGVRNYALYVAGGESRFDGQVNAERYYTAVSTAISTDGTTNLYASAGASGSGGGMIAMRDGYSRFALFWYGSYDTLTKIAGNAVFTHTKDNAGTINIYYESGNIVYQNKTTIASLSVHYTRILD